MLEKESRHFFDCLVARVNGRYRDGSTGNPDAYFLHGLIKTAVDLWSPKAVIIDFTNFQYDWGDMLELVYDAPESKERAYVVGNACRRAMSTLEFGENTQRDITEHDEFFDSFEDAFRYLKENA